MDHSSSSVSDWGKVLQVKGRHIFPFTFVSSELCNNDSVICQSVPLQKDICFVFCFIIFNEETLYCLSEYTDVVVSSKPFEPFKDTLFCKLSLWLSLSPESRKEKSSMNWLELILKGLLLLALLWCHVVVIYVLWETQQFS